MGALGEQFKSDDHNRHSEWLRGQRWFIKAKHDHQRREEIADKIEDGISALASEAVMATQAQIKTFEVKLDSYDEATVVALMENQVLIDATRERIEAMLAQAYVMEDGRRVFKTEDGTQVFDEFGEEVSADELDPNLISANRPTYEEYAADVEALATLEAERTQILEFQEKLDDTREEIADGEISEAELEELDAELLDVMPSSVRGHVAGLETDTPQADSKTDLNGQKVSSANPISTTEIGTPAPAPL